MRYALGLNNKALSFNSKTLGIDESLPILPPNTIRCKFSAGYMPIMGDSQVLVDADNNIWDIYKASSNWGNLFNNNPYLLEVIAANTTNVTIMLWMFSYCYNLTSVSLFDTSNVIDMHCMFYWCTSLTTVSLFDTSNVTDMRAMFENCSSLTTVPLFNTSNVTDMNSMFVGCTSLTSIPLFNTANVTNMNSMCHECSSLTTVPLFNTSKVTNSYCMFAQCFNVESGALALYNQMANQTVPPVEHGSTFMNCGINTQTGAAELEQIPEDWK